MKTEMKQSFVTKDMIIGDVLKQYPDVAVIMLEHGLHCVGCHANVFDPIEAGSLGHGLDEGTVERMVDQMNEFIGSAKKEEVKDLPDKVFVTDAAAQKIIALLVKGKQ